jgi:hypothetical protein
MFWDYGEISVGERGANVISTRVSPSTCFNTFAPSQKSLEPFCSFIPPPDLVMLFSCSSDGVDAFAWCIILTTCRRQSLAFPDRLS